MRNVEGLSNGWSMPSPIQYAVVHAKCLCGFCYGFALLSGVCSRTIKIVFFGAFNLSLGIRSANNGFFKDRPTEQNQFSWTLSTFINILWTVDMNWYYSLSATNTCGQDIPSAVLRGHICLGWANAGCYDARKHSKGKIWDLFPDVEDSSQIFLAIFGWFFGVGFPSKNFPKSPYSQQSPAMDHLRTSSPTCDQISWSEQFLCASVLECSRTHVNIETCFIKVTQVQHKYGTCAIIITMFHCYTAIASVRILSKANLAKGGETLRQELLERLIDCRLMGSTSQVNFNGDPSRLAMRELPHGSWSNIFLLYISYCKTTGESPASRSTFFSICQQWRSCLRFHKRTQHQICETCSKLKSKVRNSSELWWNLKHIFLYKYPTPRVYGCY